MTDCHFKVGMKRGLARFAAVFLMTAGCIAESDGVNSITPDDHNSMREVSEPATVVGEAIRNVSMTTIVKTPPETPASEYHKVQQGETLSLIATRYGKTVEQLVRVNGLGDPDHLQAGQWLYVPGDR